MDTGILNPADGSTAVTLNFSPPLVNGPGPDLVVFEVRGTAGGAAALPHVFQLQVGANTGFVFTSSWGETMSTVDADYYGRDAGPPTNISELENDDVTKNGTISQFPLVGVAIDLDELGVSPLAQISTIQFGSVALAIAPASSSVDPVLFMGIRSAPAFGADFNPAVPEPTSVVLSLIALWACCGIRRSPATPGLPTWKYVRKPDSSNRFTGLS
jgi:hypothetical protein